MERVLRNLVSNAVRYTDQGRVVVGCRRRGGAVSVQVWDTGRGIPSGQQDRVFQEYYQIENPERDRTKGLGLGLAIVRRLTNLLECRLDLCSQPGRGSCFSVTVKLSKEAVHQAGSRRRGAGGRMGARARGGHRRRGHDPRGDVCLADPVGAQRRHRDIGGRRDARLADCPVAAGSDRLRLPAARRGERDRGNRAAALGIQRIDPGHADHRRYRGGPPGRGAGERAPAAAQAGVQQQACARRSRI